MSPGEIETAVDLLLVSNTPPFLYRGLRRLPLFRELAARPIPELRALVFTADAPGAPVDTTAVGYAALGALLSVADLSTQQELATRAWQHLAWAPWFVTLDKATRPWATTVKVLAVEPPAAQVSTPSALQSATTGASTVAAPAPPASVNRHSGFAAVVAGTTSNHQGE